MSLKVGPTLQGEHLAEQGLVSQRQRPDTTVIPTDGDGQPEPTRGDISFPKVPGKNSTGSPQDPTPGLSASKVVVSLQKELAIEGERRIEEETDISVNPAHGMGLLSRDAQSHGDKQK